MIPGGLAIKSIGLIRGGVYVLATAGPTVSLLRNGVVTAVVVTVAAQPDNSYLASATIPSTWVAGDHLQFRFSLTLDGRTFEKNCEAGYIQVTNDEVVTLINQALQNQADCDNRLEYDPITGIMTRYEADGTTIQQQWQLKDADGNIPQSPFGVQTERCPI